MPNSLSKRALKKHVISIFHRLYAKLTNRIYTISPMQHSILSRKPISYSQPVNKLMFRDSFMEPNQLPPGNLNLCFFLRCCQVAQEKVPATVRENTTLSLWVIGLRLSLIWISTISSDLVGQQHHSLSWRTLLTLAFKKLATSYTILCPYTWYNTPLGCHLSCHKKIVLPSPTS